MWLKLARELKVVELSHFHMSPPLPQTGNHQVCCWQTGIHWHPIGWKTLLEAKKHNFYTEINKIMWSCRNVKYELTINFMILRERDTNKWFVCIKLPSKIALKLTEHVCLWNPLSSSGDLSGGPRTRDCDPTVLVSSVNFCEERVKEVAAHVRKCSPRGAAAATAQSAEQRRVVIAHG